MIKTHNSKNNMKMMQHRDQEHIPMNIWTIKSNSEAKGQSFRKYFTAKFKDSKINKKSFKKLPM